MKLLELFCGTKSISNAFSARGHEVYTVDWDESFHPSMTADISKLTAEDIINLCGGKPDVIWASPDCTTYSIAAISTHREKEASGNLKPKSDYAKRCDETNKHVLDLIKELSPKYWFIENPRGGLRKMDFMQGLPRYTVTYCFDGNTKIVTNDGHKPLKDICNKNVLILNKDGDWEQAVVRRYGIDELWKITLSRAGKKKIIYSTKNHKWFAALPTGTKQNYRLITTDELKPKMLLPYSIPNKKEVEIIPEYVCRGFVFGDGYTIKTKPSAGSFAQFVGEKIEMLPYFNGYGGKRWHDNKDECEIIKLCSLPIEWKTYIPDINEDYSKIFSWIAGYLAADGSCSNANGQVTLSSSKKENLEKVRELAEIIGIGTYSINEYYRKGFSDVETPLYQMTFMRGDIDDGMILREKHRRAFFEYRNVKHHPKRWSVTSVEKTGVYGFVYCCETEYSHSFTLEDNIVTHNCQYGDTRMKPTDLFTNHPNPQFKPMCKNGDSCHESAPRGSRTGTQGLQNKKERARIPKELCEHIAIICEQ